MTLAIYNTDTGELILTQDNSPIKNVGALLLDIPQGKELVKIVNGEPVYEDRPLTLEERLAQLEASQEDQDQALLELGEIIAE